MIVQGTLDRDLNKMMIAVEVFDKEAMRGSNCYKQTENRLIPAIKLCFNNIGIRHMTQEEISLMHKYQWEQHGNFRFIFGLKFKHRMKTF